MMKNGIHEKHERNVFDELYNDWSRSEKILLYPVLLLLYNGIMKGLVAIADLTPICDNYRHLSSWAQSGQRKLQFHV